MSVFSESDTVREAALTTTPSIVFLKVISIVQSDLFCLFTHRRASDENKTRLGLGIFVQWAWLGVEAGCCSLVMGIGEGEETCAAAEASVRAMAF